MKNKKYIYLWASGIIAFVGLLSLFVSYFGSRPVALGEAAVASSYNSATNASTTCGQLASGSFTIGPTSSTITNSTGTVFTIFIDGTNVTSTASATTTANAVANALALAIPSSTLGMSVGTSTDGTLITINVTSTTWGKFVTFVSGPGQFGLTYANTTAFPSTQIIGSTSARNYFSATNDTSNPNSVYLCKGASCAIDTGYAMLTTSTDSFIQNSADRYNGIYSCISSTASSSLLTITYSQ